MHLLYFPVVRLEEVRFHPNSRKFRLLVWSPQTLHVTLTGDPTVTLSTPPTSKPDEEYDKSTKLGLTFKKNDISIVTEIPTLQITNVEIKKCKNDLDI